MTQNEGIEEVAGSREISRGLRGRGALGMVFTFCSPSSSGLKRAEARFCWSIVGWST